ncbi:hypothetical protein [Streptomyces sp. NPDC058451]
MLQLVQQYTAELRSSVAPKGGCQKYDTENVGKAVELRSAAAPEGGRQAA